MVWCKETAGLRLTEAPLLTSLNQPAARALPYRVIATQHSIHNAYAKLQASNECLVHQYAFQIVGCH
jgi:hypothetical protein